MKNEQEERGRPIFNGDLCVQRMVKSVNYILKGIDFDLAQTLDCGQAFRWCAPSALWKPGASGDACAQNRELFVGIAQGRRLEISRANGEVILHDVSEDEFEKIWKNYFDIERDYGNLRALFSECSEHLKNAVEFSPGLRLLRQNSWETLVSFILSQNANIPRIKKMVEALCENFGVRQAHGGNCGHVAERSLEAMHYFDFPTPEKLAGLSEVDLAPLRLGYRAGYVLDAARRVASGEIDLHACENFSSDELCEVLQKIRGVGPKVAECVLLYGFGRVERYPADVWIRRAMSRWFPKGFPPEIKNFSGIAQQFLFHYIRTGDGDTNGFRQL
ncbi:MAG: DNA-3-methyladenine glycosylase 2 family protein [Defluviitaleaceae bacterium]|nr:DNA-3-methyladenine glycosylase 2 family protein [Defluviitaleaceae bacterium]